MINNRNRPIYKANFVWNKCPNTVEDGKRYVIDERNPRAVSNPNNGFHATVTGDMPLLRNAITTWDITITDPSGRCSTLIGVAPLDIYPNRDNFNTKYGWYIDCYYYALYSSAPHNYKGKSCPPLSAGATTKRGGISSGDVITLTMDTLNGNLAFAVNGESLGVAYEGIPLDMPLVPCVVIGSGNVAEVSVSVSKEDEPIKTVRSGARDNVDDTIPAPGNAREMNASWDFVTVAWDVIEWASWYEVEVDENKISETTTANVITTTGLKPGSEHSFRVRTVVDGRVSEWSRFVRVRTHDKLFSSGEWKGCPDYVNDGMKYTLDPNNPRVATFAGDGCCTIIGNTAIPLGQTVSWTVKLLMSETDDGNGVFIGVAPAAINQNRGDDYRKSKWHYDCFGSTLWSGPPHNYDCKQYGPRGKSEGDYIRTGDTVGVVMDTASGDLSYVVNGVNYGVAYAGIPLDRPLVPCVVLGKRGDSVELDLSEVRESVDNNSVQVPGNVGAESITWDSITLTWDKVDNASFYQIEVDGSKCLSATTAPKYTEKGLYAETNHTFRVRAARKGAAGPWCGAVRKTTQRQSIMSSAWKECQDISDDRKAYAVDNVDPRAAKKVGGGNRLCTIVGNTPVPINDISSWNIVLLESIRDDWHGIYIGIAPYDVNQTIDNHDKCGWYFYYYQSCLWSGPPQYYKGKKYVAKRRGEYVSTGDIVGVVVDTVKGVIAFAMNGVSLGVAYKKVPLDKPLVPCVLLMNKGDSVEFCPVPYDPSNQSCLIS